MRQKEHELFPVSVEGVCPELGGLGGWGVRQKEHQLFPVSVEGVCPELGGLGGWGVRQKEHQSYFMCRWRGMCGDIFRLSWDLGHLGAR